LILELPFQLLLFLLPDSSARLLLFLLWGTAIPLHLLESSFSNIALVLMILCTLAVLLTVLPRMLSCKERFHAKRVQPGDGAADLSIPYGLGGQAGSIPWRFLFATSIVSGGVMALEGRHSTVLWAAMLATLLSRIVLWIGNWWLPWRHLHFNRNALVVDAQGLRVPWKEVERAIVRFQFGAEGELCLGLRTRAGIVLEIQEGLIPLWSGANDKVKRRRDMERICNEVLARLERTGATPEIRGTLAAPISSMEGSLWL